MAAWGQIFRVQTGTGAHAPRPPRAMRHAPARPLDEPEERLAEMGAAQHSLLTNFIESQVVPRLVADGGTRLPRPVALQSSVAALGESVTAFAALLLHRTIDEALSFMAAAQDRRHTIEALYLGLITPTARHCGKLWEDDLMSFADVSIVSARLHQLLHITSRYGIETPCGVAGRDIVLLAQPGAQHRLGLSMVRAFFLKAGWRTCVAAPDTMLELAAITRENWFAVAGFAVTSSDELDAVRASIGAVRQASRNHRIGIIVGGPVLVEHPEYASQLGADSVALDGEDAVKQAEDLLVAPT